MINSRVVKVKTKQRNIIAFIILIGYREDN